jgi:hypothetical protein
MRCGVRVCARLPARQLRHRDHRSQRWADLISGALTEAQQAGTVRAGLDPDATARFLLNAWEGSLIQARAEKSSAAFDTFFKVAFGVLLQVTTLARCVGEVSPMQDDRPP